MIWGMQVLINDEWQWIHPVGGKRYEYPTETDAWNMLNICYPDQIREHRLGEKQVVRTQEIKE